MAIQDEGRGDQLGRLQAQVELILSGIPDVMSGVAGAAAHRPDEANRDYVDYLHRDRTLLVRDADVDRVTRVVSCTSAAHDSNVRGLTRMEFSADERRSVEDACTDIDRALGEGVATPEHILYVCPWGVCPATEPEQVEGDPSPSPDVSAQASDGEGVLIAIPDSGLLPGAADEHSWMHGVDGEKENPIGGYPPRILPYAGHGTFAAGVARTMAPKADVFVYKTFADFGAVFEGDLVKQMTDAIGTGAEVISLAFGTNSRHDLPLIGFEVVEERLRHHAGTVLVAAAGNDGMRRPFWPAAYPWVVGVGALNASQNGRAEWSNYGSWVDVFAPGDGLVNAFARGDYLCTEPPNVGQLRKFNGMAKWSGTSFATPLVAGLIAARIAERGENAKQAAQEILAKARSQTMRGVGPVIFPGQAY